MSVTLRLLLVPVSLHSSPPSMVITSPRRSSAGSQAAREANESREPMEWAGRSLLREAYT